MMNIRLFFYLLLLFCGVSVKGNMVNATFDKLAFYNAMSSGNLEVVNNQLNLVRSAAIPEQEAYEGALLMKKAGMAGKPKDKLSFFKSGRSKLDAAIKKGGSAEFNFLRLIIQEHAPKALNYNSDIDTDIAAIRTAYKTLPQVVQQAVSDYSKKSKALKL